MEVLIFQGEMMKKIHERIASGEPFNFSGSRIYPKFFVTPETFKIQLSEDDSATLRQGYALKLGDWVIADYGTASSHVKVGSS